MGYVTLPNIASPGPVVNNGRRDKRSPVAFHCGAAWRLARTTVNTCAHQVECTLIAQGCVVSAPAFNSIYHFCGAKELSTLERVIRQLGRREGLHMVEMHAPCGNPGIVGSVILRFPHLASDPRDSSYSLPPTKSQPEHVECTHSAISWVR